jgi:hypothetical protein
MPFILLVLSTLFIIVHSCHADPWLADSTKRHITKLFYTLLQLAKLDLFSFSCLNKCLLPGPMFFASPISMAWWRRHHGATVATRHAFCICMSECMPRWAWTYQLKFCNVVFRIQWCRSLSSIIRRRYKSNQSAGMFLCDCNVPFCFSIHSSLVLPGNRSVLEMSLWTYTCGAQHIDMACPLSFFSLKHYYLLCVITLLYHASKDLSLLFFHCVKMNCRIRWSKKEKKWHLCYTHTVAV